MQDRQKAQDYRAILLADTPLIDVRAPIEFEQGAMPGAINLPLMRMTSEPPSAPATNVRARMRR